ncbi:MAG: hypothetical protein ACJ764_02345 [Solirubrobacteraceae bacterium]
MPQRFLPALAVTAALVIAGCGGSSTHSTTTSHAAAQARATFVAQLNSVCMRANAAFAAAHTHSGQVAVVSHYIHVFSSVFAPAELRALYAKYLAVLEQELAALKSGDTNALFALAHSKAKPLAKQLGAKGCITSS